MESYKPWQTGAYYDGFNILRETLGVPKKREVGTGMAHRKGGRFDVEATKLVLQCLRYFYPDEVHISHIAQWTGLDYGKIRSALEVLSIRASLYIKTYYHDGTEVPEEVQDKNGRIGKKFYGLLKRDTPVREVDQ